MVYTCISGADSYTYAFNAHDGSLRWQTATDCSIVDIPFGDYAVPIVQNGIVYDGTYALSEQDGKVLWHTNIDTQTEGTLSLQALVGNTLYANTQNDVYAIDATNGKMRWRYTPDTQMPIGGQLVVADHMLYVGTLGSVDQPQASAFYALDADNGNLRWQYQMGDYTAAAIHNNMIYVASRDQHLYAFDKNSGSLRWKFTFPHLCSAMPAIADNVLYVTADGVYALNSANGTVIWNRSLGSSPSVYFTPPVVASGVLYLASINGSGQSILYALHISNGAEYWHSFYPSQAAPLVVE